MRELPAEIQEEIRRAWRHERAVPFDSLIERFPAWTNEIEELVIGFLADEADELPQNDRDLEDVIFRILDQAERDERHRDQRLRLEGIIDLERRRQEREEREG
jgi:hypothetical protein